MKLRVLFNPRAGTGASAAAVPRLMRVLRDAGMRAELAVTHRPGHATELARAAFDHGCDCLVVVGGDGTLNEVCQAYLSPSHGRPRPRLAMVPAGTGSDFARTFGLRSKPELVLASIEQGAVQAVDLGVVQFTGPGGVTLTRAFANVTSFGLGGLTDRIVERGPKWLGGRAAFFLGAVRALAAYQNVAVRLLVDGQECLQAPIMNVAIANGRYFGGGMHIAPDADPGDGLLDVVAMYDLSRAQGLALARKLYRGTHPGSPGVQVARGFEVRAHALRPEQPVLIDVDGETPGCLPLRAWAMPHALQLCIPSRLATDGMPRAREARVVDHAL